MDYAIWQMAKPTDHKQLVGVLCLAYCASLTITFNCLRPDGAGAAAGQDPRPQTMHDAETTHQKDVAGMKIETINGRDYRLPGGLNEFQLRLYVHLIEWKRAHITDEPGSYEYQGRQILYDAILPRKMIDDLRIIYPPMVDELRRHRKENRFRLHTHFNHMAQLTGGQREFVPADSAPSAW